jgi:hypothetical protein
MVYMEDVGRHNAVDKIAGWMFRHEGQAGDKILYTTGRLTSEMVIKCALMGIPVLASRSGFTAWGVEIARQVGLTLIGRMRGQRFVCLSGEERLIRDADPVGGRGGPQAPPQERRDGLHERAAGGDPRRRARDAHGRRRQGPARGRRPAADRPCDRPAASAGARARDQRQRRSGAACRIRPAGPARQPEGPSRAAGGGARRARLGGGAGGGGHRHRRRRHALFPARPGGAAAGAAGPSGLALAASPDETGRMQRHPTFGLWPVALRDDLRAALRGGLRKIVLWTDGTARGLRRFESGAFDPFFNVNTPEDIARAEERLGAGMRVYGVTGWKNTGKTGLMERLVAEITGAGLRVSTVKHAHHATEIDHPGRDSIRHREAGARR